MLALIVPDCHLKPYMFDRADKILASGQADFAVQLGDLVDDWGQQWRLDAYKATLDRALKFHEEHPDTLWVIGNHDALYLHPELPHSSGYSPLARPIVQPRLERLPFKVAHIVDNCVFSHAGIDKNWVWSLRPGWRGVSYDEVELGSLIEEASPEDLWRQDSPLWLRPQLKSYEPFSNLWGASFMLHVVGHTPVPAPIEKDHTILSTDTFSTYSNRLPIGDQTFVIVDTETREWRIAQEAK